MSDLPTSVVLKLPWSTMSSLVKYKIVVHCDEIVFCDGSRAKRQMDILGTWALPDTRYEMGPESEALAFVRRQNAAKPYLWQWEPSPAKVAQAMAELRKRRTA